MFETAALREQQRPSPPFIVKMVRRVDNLVWFTLPRHDTLHLSIPNNINKIINQQQQRQ